jgi:hypothetical protein
MDHHPPPGFDPIGEKRMKELQNGYKTRQPSGVTATLSHPHSLKNRWPSPERKKKTR